MRWRQVLPRSFTVHPPVPWCLVVGETGAGERCWEEGIVAFNSTRAGSPGVEHSRSRQLHRAPEPLSESRAGGARRVVSAAAWRICQVEGQWRPFHKLWLLIERGGEASHRRTRSSKALL